MTIHVAAKRFSLRSRAAIALMAVIGTLSMGIIPASAAAGGNTLNGAANESVNASGSASLFSNSHSPTYEARMQTDGNFVVYGPNGPLWASYTHGGSGSRMVMQSDGNLVLYDNGSVLFATGTSGSGTRLVMQDDGNLVIYSSNGTALWATYTNGGASRMQAAGAVASAKQQLGKPYVYGATGPNSFDCSGLTKYAYASVGLGLSRTSQDQWKQGTAISRADLQPGDLLFYYGPNPSHVTMYIGAGKMIQALKTGTNVKVDSIDAVPNYLGARRVS